MSLFKSFFIFSIIASGVILVSSAKKLPNTARTTDELREALESVGGCNTNICFALDGSGSITREQYEMEKNFVLDMVAVLAGYPLEVAAVQYARSVTPISFLTSDMGAFNLAVDASRFRGQRLTNIPAGIIFCHRELLKAPGESNKIVIVGDGRNNFGGNAVRRANQFRKQTGGKVAVVGIGFIRERKLLRLAGHDPNLVLSVYDYDALADLVADMVMMVCGVELF